MPDVVAKIKAVIAGLSTYGFRHVLAVLKRQALVADSKPNPNGSTA